MRAPPALSVVSIALAAGIVSTLLWSIVREQELASRKTAFEELAGDGQQALQRALDLHLQVLHSVEALFAASREVELDEFRAFTAGELARYPAIEALAWAPRTAERREAFEHALPGGRIVERDAGGDVIRARKRNVHFPLHFVTPERSADELTGLDLASDVTLRSTMDTARDRGAVRGVLLRAEKGSGSGPIWVTLLPVYGGERSPATVEERRRSLEGFLVGRCRLARLAALALETLPPYVEVVLGDEDGAPCFRYPPGNALSARPFSSPGRSERDAGSRLAWRGTVDVGNGLLPLTCFATGRFGEAYGTWRSWLVLAGGLLVALYLSARALRESLRTREIERLVDERTAELRNEIEEREVAEAALRESEQRLQRLVETIADGIVIVQKDGNISFANAMAEKVLGISREAMTERTYDDEAWKITTPDGRPFPDEELPVARAMATGEAVFEVELAVAQADGTRVILSVNAAPLRDRGGAITGAVASISDITRQKELDRLKNEFVSTVSHELRTPLSSLRGFTELMLNREYTPAKQREFLTIINNEAVRLTNLINDFLDIQRMESGRQRYDFKVVDFALLAGDVLRLHGESSGAHALSFTASGDLPPVRADRDRLRQVLSNLISNAIKFSPRGGEVSVGARRDGGELVAWVRDRGIGIPADVLPKLFTKFFRADNDETRSIGGTGLGLALVKEIIESHSGRVWVESEAGKGSTFYFTLPVAGSSVNRRSPSPSGTRTADVLVVEDDHAFGRLLRERFELDGLVVGVAPSGEEALELSRRSRPRLAIIDIHLAGSTDGWDLLLALKSDPELRNVPVLIISESEVVNSRGLALAGAEYLLKPVSRQWLLETVRRQLGSPQGKRVIVVDDDERFRRQVREWLLDEEGLRVEEAACGREALATIDAAVPDLLLLDLLMPNVDGFEVLGRLREDRRWVNLPVVVITGKDLEPEDKAYIKRRMATLVQKREAGADYIVEVGARLLEVEPSLESRG